MWWEAQSDRQVRAQDSGCPTGCGTSKGSGFFLTVHHFQAFDRFLSYDVVRIKLNQALLLLSTFFQ